MCFVNKMDRVGADFYRCVDMISDRLGAVPLVIQLPIGSEADFEGIVDILNMKEVVWKQDTLGAEFEIKEIRSELKNKAEDYRKKLVELAVELDDNVMEQYLEGNEPDVNFKKLYKKRNIKR